MNVLRTRSRVLLAMVLVAAACNGSSSPSELDGGRDRITGSGGDAPGSGGLSTGSGGRISPADGGAGGAAGSGGAPAKGLTLYYVRHAQVLANVDPSLAGTDAADTFTDLGLRQITALTTYLQGLPVTPDAILVSPAPRAQKTIEPYLLAKSLTGEIWMELNESSDAVPTGAPMPDAPKYYQYYKATIVAENLVFRDPSATKYWQNDTYEAGLLMVTTAKKGLLDRFGQSGKTIVVVGHAIAGQIMIGLLLGQDMTSGPPTTGPSAVYLLNTGIMRLVQDPTTGSFKLDGRNINNPPA